jgi:hypothetical protein
MRTTTRAARGRTWHGAGSAADASGGTQEPQRDPRWDPQWIVPRWPIPREVRALITTRAGGYSTGRFGSVTGQGGLNLGRGGPPAGTQGSQDEKDPAVMRNRERLREALPGAPLWLHQVHGARVIDAALAAASAAGGAAPQADASFTTSVGVVCAVLTADCLPVLLADVQGRGVAAAHAGWRGLAAGVIQNAVHALRQAVGDSQARILAYLGPAIGPQHFEVGPEVLEAMRQGLPRAQEAFAPGAAGRYRADLFALARQALEQAGVTQVFGEELCTASDPVRFFSFRRDRVTGRQAALIWRET